MSKPVTLPDKPSALIRLALADLAKCERSPKYKINMAWWLKGPDAADTVCKVCLAGAVMAQTLRLKVESDKEIMPISGSDDGRKLSALDWLRQGGVNSACNNLGIQSPIENRSITPYNNDSKLFRKQMRALANDLAKAGL